MKDATTMTKPPLLPGILISLCGLNAHADLAAMELVSVGNLGYQPRDHSVLESISGDGRYVAFSSVSPDLVAGDDNGRADIFVADRVTRRVERISVSSAGDQADNQSNNAALSHDGRYVAFASTASNLVPDDTNGALDIFVRDRLSGQTERVSLDSSGAQASGPSFTPHLSGDGRFVVFWSRARDLVAEDTGGVGQVYVRDRQTGTTTLISISEDGQPANADALQPRISADGRFVAFASAAGNLVPGDSNGKADIFVHDRAAGALERVSLGQSGEQANDDSSGATLSADGRYVLFTSSASNLVPGDTNHAQDAFVYDRLSRQLERVSVGNAGVQANQYAIGGSISADGRRVSFASPATNLADGEGNSLVDVFVRDLQDGMTRRISDGYTGAAANQHSGVGLLSADGHYVAFSSRASNLVAKDYNGYEDVFVATLADGAVTRDTDKDGIPDSWEQEYGFNPLDAGDAGLDSDGDGLTSLEEYLAGTHPHLADTDSDGLPDGWEVMYDLNPRDPATPDGDHDSDGLATLEEYEAGSNPRSTDTDADGLPDLWEVRYGLNPADASDAEGDPDGDGASNRQEYLAGSNPLNPDTDGDGMTDGWEILNGLNPVDARDAGYDMDLDGYNNLKEFKGGSDPRDRESVPPRRPGLLGWLLSLLGL